MQETHYKQFLTQNPYPRSLKSYETLGIHLNYAGKEMINFSSNDYLGLATHPLLIQRANEFTQKYGVGSASSRSVVGHLAVFDEIENELAKAIGKPACLILSTGFQTNRSVLEALLDVKILGKEPLVFCDRLCHISMLPSTRVHRFRHNDLNHLEQLIQKQCDPAPKFILAESLYSMEGDEADLEGLIAIAKKNNAMLYIDDAHSVGVDGWGKASKYANDIDVIMGTFSKALGSMGGYIACSSIIRNYLINKCKGFIYSTALSPAIWGAISAAQELVPKLQAEQTKLSQLATDLRYFFNQHGLNTINSTSHIIPWLIGDAEKTLRISQLLAEEKILGATIRPPTVPKGQSRIRFCLSSAHTPEDITQLKRAILKILQVESIL